MVDLLVAMASSTSITKNLVVGCSSITVLAIPLIMLNLGFSALYKFPPVIQRIIDALSVRTLIKSSSDEVILSNKDADISIVLRIIEPGEIVKDEISSRKILFGAFPKTSVNWGHKTSPKS